MNLIKFQIYGRTAASKLTTLASVNVKNFSISILGRATFVGDFRLFCNWVFDCVVYDDLGIVSLFLYDGLK